MKHMKRTNVYQTSNYNCTFDPKTIQAKSYKWWTFVARIDGVTVFNNYKYSVTTAKHQSKVRRLMQELGIKIDVELRTQSSLTNYLWDLAALYVSAEENDCDAFLREEEKKISRNERAALKREIVKQARVAKQPTFSIVQSEQV